MKIGLVKKFVLALVFVGVSSLVLNTPTVSAAEATKPIDADTLAKCRAEDKSAADCTSAWNECIKGGDEANCKSLVGAGDTEGAKKAGTGAKTSCNIEKIGWLVCPLLSFMSKVVDATYGVVSKLLTVQPILADGQTVEVYNSWSIVRNIANVAFVLAFLIIGYSQITGKGASNYSIKRMLPRLVVAAILVNVSYWLCAIAVDVSNIIGTSANALFKGIGVDMAASGVNPETGEVEEVGAFAGGGNWQSISAGLVAGPLVYLALPALLTALPMALLTIVIVFLVLTLRQALIILLIVASPLAFVAYLLPNTEGIFKKWKGLFQSLLVMFPAIALMFGVSGLASQIIMATAGDDIIRKIMGAFVAIAPLAVTPLMVKSSTTVLGKFADQVSRRAPNGVFGKTIGNRVERMQGNRKVRGLGGGSGPEAYRKFRAKTSSASRERRGELKKQAVKDKLGAATAGFDLEDKRAQKSVMSSAESNLAANAAKTAQNTLVTSALNKKDGTIDPKSQLGLAGNNPAVQSALAAQQTRAMAEAVKEVELSSEIAPGAFDEMADKFEQATAAGDTVTAKAMQNMMLQGGDKGVDAYRKKVQGMEASGTIDHNSDIAKSLAANVVYNHSGLKGTAADIHRQATGGGSLSAASSNPDTWDMSDEDLVTQKTSSLEAAVKSGGVTNEQAQRILDDPRLSSKLKGGQKAALESVKSVVHGPAGPPPGWTPPPPPTPPASPPPATPPPTPPGSGWPSPTPRPGGGPPPTPPPTPGPGPTPPPPPPTPSPSPRPTPPPPPIPPVPHPTPPPPPVPPVPRPTPPTPPTPSP